MLGLGLGLNRFNLAALPMQRYFSTFDPVLNTYGELDTAFTPSGDFDVTMLVYADDFSVQQVLFGQAGSTIDFFRSTSTTTFELRTTSGGSRILTAPDALEAGKLNTVRLSRSGGNVAVAVNGGPLGATESYSFLVSIDAIGYKSGQYFDGIIANVKLTDLATPAHSRILPVGLSGGASVENSTINTGSITYYNLPSGNQERFTFDSANNRWIGVDELGIALGGTWQDNGGGNYEETVSFGSFLQLGGTAGYSYLVKYTDAVGNPTLQVNNGVDNVNLPGQTQVVVAPGTQPPRLQGSAGSSLTPATLQRLLEIA